MDKETKKSIVVQDNGLARTAVVLAFVSLLATIVIGGILMQKMADLQAKQEVQKGDVSGLTVRVDQMEQWATGFSQAVVQGFQRLGVVSTNSTQPVQQGQIQK